MLVFSNIFMTFAWYGHLKLQEMKISTGWPLILIILFSWGIAFFEYCLTVPANRIGFQQNGGPFTLVQLKVIQEVISLTVFSVIVFFVFKGEQLHWNHFAAFACLTQSFSLSCSDSRYTSSRSSRSRRRKSRPSQSFFFEWTCVFLFLSSSMMRAICSTYCST